MVVGRGRARGADVDPEGPDRRLGRPDRGLSVQVSRVHLGAVAGCNWCDLGNSASKGVTMDRDRSNPAMLYAGVVGATLVVAGIIGFFYNAEFTSDSRVRDAVFGGSSTSTAGTTLVHILTGCVWACWPSAAASQYPRAPIAMARALVYLVAGGLGLRRRRRRLDPQHHPGQHRGQHPPPAARRRRASGRQLTTPAAQTVRPASANLSRPASRTGGCPASEPGPLGGVGPAVATVRGLTR